MARQNKLPLADILPLTAAVNEAGHLTLAGCDALELAREFGTPLYVFDEETLRRQCREFQSQFRSRHPDTVVAYAAKAYLGRALAAILALSAPGAAGPWPPRQTPDPPPSESPPPDASARALREAVELVLEASALGAAKSERAGGIFVLDMGEPVKILDLAKQMIRLAEGDEALGMGCRFVDAASVLDRDDVVVRRMEDEERAFQPADGREHALPAQIVEELPFDSEALSGDRELGLTVLLDLRDPAQQFPAQLEGVARGTDRRHGHDWTASAGRERDLAERRDEKEVGSVPPSTAEAGVGQQHERVADPHRDVAQFGVDSLSGPVDGDDGGLVIAPEPKALQGVTHQR